MWSIQLKQYQVGPFFFVVMGDPTSSDSQGCKRLFIRCSYDGKLSDSFSAIRPEGNSDFIPVIHQDPGMDRPWFDKQGNRWARAFSSDSQFGLVGLLAIEIARHWLEDATAYELQHMSTETYAKVQGWVLGKQEDF